MSHSFRKIDYSIRPAKHAERRMLCDIFRRVSPFERVEKYVYVGFGSVWFADFILFHRALGIRDMVSIEAAESAKDRIEENKPFRIPVAYEQSKDALPKLDWSRKQFLWLDYDDPLSTDMLYDLQTVTRHSTSGTLIAVTVQCSQAPQIAAEIHDSSVSKVSALERFISTFGRQRVPQQTETEDLYGWRFGTLSRKLLLDEIEAGLALRNASSTVEMQFRLICEIEYEDGAKMTTLVGIIHSVSDLTIVNQCNFDSLEFLEGSMSPIRIDVPKLTVREFKRLECQLPLSQDAELQLGTIPVGEARGFQKMYRYLPSFAVLET
jgi:hypothetical protein